MKLSLPIIGLLLLAGCQEPFSNEDILFLKALPRGLEIDVPDEADKTVRGLSPAQATEDGPAQYYREMVRTATAVNEGIFEVLGVLEEITAAPATIRDGTRRAWGPFEPPPNEQSDPERPIEILLVVDRIDTSTIVKFTTESPEEEVDSFYQYGVNVRRVGSSEWQSVVNGTTVLLSAEEDQASGDLCINFDEIRPFDPKEDAKGVFCVRYDFRNQIEVIELAAIGDAQKGNLFADPAVEFTYLRRPDNSGRFFFSVRGNAFGTPDPEVFNILVRWIDNLAGRADVEVCGGDVPTGQGLYAAECWNTNFRRTWLLTNVPGEVQNVGVVGNCPAEFRDDPINAGSTCN